MKPAVEQIRALTRGTAFEGRLYLVGGVLRDTELGLPPADDVDLVVEGNALDVADLLRAAGITDHAPVVYPRFGTAMVGIGGTQVELVSARAESYDPHSRKPRVELSSLAEDAFRRDFTINTLMENLHTGMRLDLTGQGLLDLRAGVIRTPREPAETFYDDPLRMLRAVRFAARFGFRIEESTWAAVRAHAHRLSLFGPAPRVVSEERIRDEFCKTLMTARPAHGVRLLLEAGLLQQFAPELAAMAGVTQNAWHHLDVLDHTLRAVESLPAEASLEVRLAVLLHDVGKPGTRSEDSSGVHFYDHQTVGARIAHDLLTRLRLPNVQIDHVRRLVLLHMRLGEARPEWSEAALRRLVRDTADLRPDLFTVARADHAAMNPTAPVSDLGALETRLDGIAAATNVQAARSPLDGREVLDALGVQPGPVVGQAKEMLTNAVVEGRLAEHDKYGARALLLEWWSTRNDTH